jgi:DNA polymerase III alpha subunit (gram-positive type)
MRQYVFVDTETTGLDPDNDELVELTYGTIQPYGFVTKTLYFGVETVPEFVDNMIKFTERGIAGRMSTPEEIQEYRDFTRDQTMVAANPSFDGDFLKKNSLYEFHYRMLDIESFAAGILGLNFMPGMKDIYNLFIVNDVELPEPQHTSESDVLAMMAIYKELTRKW